MTVLPILEHPDKRLLRRAAPVENFDSALLTLCEDMAHTMYHAHGVGLAATQVNVLQRVFVADVSAERNQLQVFVNPQIISRDGEQCGEEGCLSVPGYYEKVARAARIVVRAQDSHGQPFTLEADQLLAVCIQHEIDHLDGILFVHHLSRLKQSLLGQRLRKEQRERQHAAPL